MPQNKRAYDTTTFLRDLIPSALAGSAVAGREYMKTAPMDTMFGFQGRHRYQGPRDRFSDAVSAADVGMHNRIDDALNAGTIGMDEADRARQEQTRAYDSDMRRNRMEQGLPYAAHALDALGMVGTGVSDAHPVIRTLSGYAGDLGLRTLLNKYAPQHMSGPAAHGAASALGQMLGRSASRGVEGLFSKTSAVQDILPSLLAGAATGGHHYLKYEHPFTFKGPKGEDIKATLHGGEPVVAEAYRAAFRDLYDAHSSELHGGRDPSALDTALEDMRARLNAEKARAEKLESVPAAADLGHIGAALTTPGNHKILRNLAGYAGDLGLQYAGDKLLQGRGGAAAKGALSALGQYLGRSASRYAF